MRVSPALFRDSVAVETYLGDSAYGPLYDDPVTVACRVSATRQLVRNAAGDEVISEATVYALPANAALFVAESRLTIAGAASIVLGVSPQGRPGETNLVKVTCS